ncbi:DUF982 domain-containing protein [Aurantimonas sp. A2-1-M11]|uniref:DUF982 domain-containing protein n=1 Tax=Aurantimonas sp. A2-1-M11 TaxID=3113712 RepID=UPI002F93F7DD
MFVEMFDTPVFIRDGKHLALVIRSVPDALDFLVPWVGSRHDVRAEALLRACYDVQAGYKPASMVQKNLITFAKFNDIWDEPKTLTPSIEVSEQIGISA